MTNLTKFQNQLISDLQNEFAKLNPPTSNDGRFSINALKQSISDLEAFKDSIFKYNRTMALTLEQDFNAQIEKFNEEFSPVKLEIRNHRDIFNDEYTYKCPRNADLAFYFEGERDVNRYQGKVIFNIVSVKLELPYDTITCYKIKGLLWSRLGSLKQTETNQYKSLDEFLQADKNFQQHITNQYKELTK